MDRSDFDSDFSFELSAMELATIDAVDDSAERRALAEASELSRNGIEWHVALEHAMRAAR